MPRATVGLVGGSDRVKILEQMQGEEAVAKYGFKHCQRHNEPQGSVLLTTVTSFSHITSFYTNLYQTYSESRPSTVIINMSNSNDINKF